MPKLPGQMSQDQLSISLLLEYAALVHANQEIVSRTIEDPTKMHRYTYCDSLKRSKQLANVLETLGVGEGDRVASIAWNTYRHFELFFGVSGKGAVLHTINPRLPPDHLAFVINHAEDKILFVDLTFFGFVDKMHSMFKTVEKFVVLTDAEHMPATTLTNVLCYEQLLAAAEEEYSWPLLDERAAAFLCYTSGTTGFPKGVLYSHRSTVLHCQALIPRDVGGLGAAEVLMPMVPMFHVNAWGLPFAACISGSKLVLPGSGMDGKSIYDMLLAENATVSAGVPTVWTLLLNHMEQNDLRLPNMDRTIIGGAAVSPAMISAFENLGVQVKHAWGMTEMSPLGTMYAPTYAPRSPEEDLKYKLMQGRQVFGVEMKVVDEKGKTLARNGSASGSLLVRGPWVVNTYFKHDKPCVDAEGWFDTGDIASLTPDGFMRITDRAKDLIKTGGEWISSIDLENIALAHPAVAQAAVIGVAHPKWDERPLLVLVAKLGCDGQVEKEDVLQLFRNASALPKFAVPDDVVFLDSLPLGGTGKIVKTKLREQFKAHYTRGALQATKGHAA